MSEDSRVYVAYCGLNCRMCSLIATLPGLASRLHDTMKEDGWEYYGSEVYPEFEAFWKVLKGISQMDATCPGCYGGCGDPDCAIRKCAVDKGLELCAFCDEFPCQRLTDFTRRYPFLLENGLRIRIIGLESWLREQDELVAQGVTNRSLCQPSKN